MSRVLQVVTDTDRRGAQRFALDLAGPLAATGHEVETVALSAGRYPDGLDLRVLGPSRRARQTFASLRREMAAADVVLAHGSTTLPLAAISGAGLSTPFVYRSIGDPRYWSDTLGRRLRTGAWLRRASAVVALWPEAAHAIATHLRVPRDRTLVSPNAVPAERCPPVTHALRAEARARFDVVGAGRVLVFVGSLSGEKRVHAAIDVMSDLPRDSHMLVVGDGPLRGDLERQAEEVAPGRVLFLGTLDDATPAYHAADLLVLPSASEGMPAVPIEAGLCGIPTVATAVGGLAEIVRDGVNGRLAPLGDQAALARAVVQVLDDAVEQGRAARAWCLERFTVEAVAHDWDRLIRRLVAGSA